MTQIFQSQSPSHNYIFVMEVFVMKKKKCGIRSISYTASLCMCNISTSHNKVTGWGYLNDPVLSSKLLLYSCMQSRAETRLLSLCNYTSLRLQGHSVTLRICHCFACCWIFWMKSIYSWLKWGEAPTGRVIATPPHCASVITCWKDYLHSCSEKRISFFSFFFSVVLVCLN